jgi:hypothetical protein
MTYFIITAHYEPKMDERREQRILDALERCDVTMDDPMPGLRFNGQEVQGTYSDVDWKQGEDGTETQLEIYAGNDPTRASRLASELRACGMVVNVDAANEEESVA